MTNLDLINFKLIYLRSNLRHSKADNNFKYQVNRGPIWACCEICSKYIKKVAKLSETRY